jgi:hypothetical protein
MPDENPRSSVWGDDVGVNWQNATDAQRERFALTRLYWFFMMVNHGGPDGSELDDLVAEEAKEAADWYWPRLEAMAGEASGTGS